MILRHVHSKKASENMNQAKRNPTLQVQNGTDWLHKRTAAKWQCKRGGKNQTALDQKTKCNFSSVSDHCVSVCVGLSTHRKQCGLQTLRAIPPFLFFACVSMHVCVF